MLDRFIYGDAERLSPEAPVPVVRLRSRSAQAGGAANVAANVRSLGGEAVLLGAVGDDDAGRELLGLLDALGVDARAVQVTAAYPTTVKTRVVARGQQLIRLDEESPAAFPSEARAELLRGLEMLLSDLAAVIISDYAKGSLDTELLAQVCEKVRFAGLPLIADPKPVSIASYKGVSVVKPNLSEARVIAGGGGQYLSPPELCEAVLASSGAHAAAVTAGGDGMYVQAGTEFRHIPGHRREVFDVAGAGDSTLAAMGLALAAGANVFEAAWIGNLAGSIAVSHIGVVAVQRVELLSEIEAPHGEH
jgi:rfaE bifunctional protein kinase chain/domain